jgi:hypothetical protein
LCYLEDKKIIRAQEWELRRGILPEGIPKPTLNAVISVRLDQSKV